MGAVTVPGSTRWPGGKRLRDGHELYWWVELAVVVVVYVVYESVRNANKAGADRAYDNALAVIEWQDALHLNVEQAWQDWAIRFEPLIVVSNYFYGSAYIVLTVAGLIFLYRLFPDHYPLWRNTLAVGTLLALIGFSTFPLMPPRLLDTMDPSFRFVDTLVEFPTFWSFESETMAKISNQYAAMPSLHCGWAFWGCAVFLPRVRSWWGKALAIAYPVATIIVVVITANHYFLDAVGGAVVMGIGFGVAVLATRAGRGEPRDHHDRVAAGDGAPPTP